MHKPSVGPVSSVVRPPLREVLDARVQGDAHGTVDVRCSRFAERSFASSGWVLSGQLHREE